MNFPRLSCFELTVLSLSFLFLVLSNTSMLSVYNTVVLACHTHNTHRRARARHHLCRQEVALASTRQPHSQGPASVQAYRTGGVTGSEGQEGANGVEGGIGVGVGNGDANGDANGNEDGDGAGTGTGVEVNEGAQGGSGDGSGDGAGTGTGAGTGRERGRGWGPVDEHRMGTGKGTGTEARTVAEMGTGTTIAGTGTRTGSGRA